ncbi:MAG: beta-1,6-N-acetylglucosaminyltransferase [Erysipelotrichaceae bacterium]|nr:beta-1,6-N-acetylglucosaminyltransferase [Erysipelotrichaceae bacterium]
MNKDFTNQINTKSKFAILIMAHHQFDILKKLLMMLDDERNDIYIHIDKKAKSFNPNEFENICKKSHIIFLPRMSVYWGHSSIVECELRMMEAALNSGINYSYIHLLSGQDLQIKKNEDIFKFFDENPNKQFIALRNVYSGIYGMNRYYFFMPIRYYNKYISRGLDIISEYIQKKLKVNRLKNIDYQLCKCQQWVSITSECARYIVSQREFIKNFTKFTCCSDEMFLGTIIVNSPFKDQIYHPYHSLIGHMRLIDRERPEGASPHTMTMSDWNMIESSPCFWSRKFDINKDTEIIDKVFEKWKS